MSKFEMIKLFKILVCKLQIMTCNCSCKLQVMAYNCSFQVKGNSTEFSEANVAEKISPQYESLQIEIWKN